MTNNEIIDQINSRIYIMRAIVEAPKPDWLNPHDFHSGKYIGTELALKEQIQWLEKLLSRIEQSQ